MVMDGQNNLSAKIINCCRRARKVLKVIQIIIAVTAALTLLAGILILCDSARFDPILEREYAAGNLKIEEELGSAGIMSLLPDPDKYYSEGKYSLPLFILSMTAFVAEILTLATVIIIRNILGEPIDEGSPFSGSILKKLKIGFVIITAYLLMTAGLVTAVAAGLMLWCVYMVLEYGAALRS